MLLALAASASALVLSPRATVPLMVMDSGAQSSTRPVDINAPQYLPMDAEGSVVPTSQPGDGSEEETSPTDRPRWITVGSERVAVFAIESQETTRDSARPAAPAATRDSAPAAAPAATLKAEIIPAGEDPDTVQGVKGLMQKVKEAGLAGAIAYAGWELIFWAVSVPVCLAAYVGVTGHLPNWSDQEDMAKLGTEAFAFVNLARFAVPLRIGLALGSAPFVQKQILDRFAPGVDAEEH